MVPGEWLTHLYDELLPSRNNVLYTPELVGRLKELQWNVDLYNGRYLFECGMEEVRQGRAGPSECEKEIMAFIEETIKETPGLNIAACIEAMNAEMKNLAFPTEYTTEDIHGNVFTLPLPKVDADQVGVLVLKDYNEIAKNMNAPKGSVGSAMYTVEPRLRKNQHDFKKGCCKSDSNDRTITKPYEYWKNRFYSKDVSGKVWSKTIWNGQDEDYNYDFVDAAQLTPEQIEEDDQLLKDWRDYKAKIDACIEKHKTKLKEVDQIILFSLGALYFRRSKTFFQHLIAHHIQSSIFALRKASDEYSSNPAVKVIAQDPAYCAHCTYILKSVLEIEVVPNFAGHLALTEKTLTMSVAPGAPVCQVIADLTLGNGGPVAMICDVIGDDCFAQQKAQEAFGSDEPTKNMVEYKGRCGFDNLDDAKHVLGVSWSEFKNEYSEAPAIVLNKWTAKGKDISVLTKFYTPQYLNEKTETLGKGNKVVKLSDVEIEKFGKRARSWKRDGNVYFPDVGMYVRKD